VLYKEIKEMKKDTLIILCVSIVIVMGIAFVSFSNFVDEKIEILQTRINEQSDLIRDMRVITNAYDQLIIEHEALQEEYQDFKEKKEMIQALDPLKEFFTDDDILTIIDEIPHGTVFSSDFLIMAGFGDSVTEHGRYRDHKGIDIIPVGDDWMITPIASGMSTTFTIDTVYGKAVTIQHSDRVRSFYAHGSNVYYRALPGEQVESDSIIMRMGNTGTTYSNGTGTGAHLHFMLEIFNGEQWIAIDPLPFLER
jgi:murein DD-endopeptidase MepM/ murein hydrolase activator NlpD